MPEQVKLDGMIFGYDTLIRSGREFIALRGTEVPELRKGMRVVMLGDSRGYVPHGFKHGEEVTIDGFTEAFKRGETDHIIRVTNGTRVGWVKPSNVEKPFRSGIFVSYSHADRDWLKRLQTHLAPYVSGESLFLWDDTKITAGSDWAGEIDQAIAKARVVVLLVSPEFLASKYVTQVELPAILLRAGSDLKVFWIPVRHSAFFATPLKDYQAAHDPSRPLADLSPSAQDEALVAISKKIAAAVDINVVANALRIIDDFQPQVNAFVTGTPEPEKEVVYSYRAKQEEASITLVEPSGARQIVTAQDLEKLDPSAQKLIRAYERTIKELFERWTELKPKRIAEDEETRREARDKSDDVRRELCCELNGLLGFIESMGMSLRDHYVHVRYICSQPLA
jgi:hypothetical protein